MSKDDNERTIHQHFYQHVGNVAGRDVVHEAPSGFVYFRDMTWDQLIQCKLLSEQGLNRARKEIFYSTPAVVLAVHIIGVILILLNFVEFIGILKQLQQYMILVPASFLATIHFMSRRANKYAPLIREYKQELAGIEKELLHRKISSR